MLRGVVSQEVSKISFEEPIKPLERQLELLVQTGLQLTKSHDLEAIVQSATDAGLELCGARFGAFFYNVTNAAGERYRLYVLSGADAEKFRHFPMPHITRLFEPTFVGTSIVRSGDITRDERYGKHSPFFGMPAGHLPVCSYLAVPVQGRSGEVLGCLLYGHQEPDIFQESAERLVATVAAQAAVAIENARLREQLTRKIEDLEQVQLLQQGAAKRVEELAAIVENSEDAILSKDLNGTITSWNQAATRILGYAPEEMIGQSIFKIIPEEFHDSQRSVAEKISRGEAIEHFETVRRTKSGELRDVSLAISPVRNESGIIVGCSKIMRDISAHKKMEKSLVQAEKIAATGRMAATIAHEINNPLEAVMNLLFLLRPSVQDTEGAGYLATAESELTRVSHIAKQSLGYYREHASAVRVPLSQLVEHAADIYEPRCAAGDIKIVRHIEDSEPISIRRGEMMQVVSNLITNAIYAMPAGGTITLSVRPVQTDRNGIIFTIQDDGVGIEQKNLPKVFDAFFTTRSTIGTGIGLFVARQFVEGHGGSISIASSAHSENHGTCVTVFLPRRTRYDEADVSEVATTA